MVGFWRFMWSNFGSRLRLFTSSVVFHKFVYNFYKLCYIQNRICKNYKQIYEIQHLIKLSFKNFFYISIKTINFQLCLIDLLFHQLNLQKYKFESWIIPKITSFITIVPDSSNNLLVPLAFILNISCNDIYITGDS